MSQNVLPMQLRIDPEQCVHQRIACSVCDACVTACPTLAWRMTDDGLSFDTDCCDACGLCVAACPHEALSIAAPDVLTVAPMTASLSKKIGLALACEYAPHGLSARSRESTQSPMGVTRCLHSMSSVWLFDQAQKTGASDWYFLTGDCATCARTPEPTLHTRWQALAVRFELMGLPLPVLHWCSLAEWAHLRQLLVEESAGAGAASLFKQIRPFFRSGAHPSSAPPKAKAVTSGRVALTRLLKQSKQQASATKSASGLVPFWAVNLDMAVCHWCMACLRVCPRTALYMSISVDEKRGLFCIDNERCTGCGVCAEVCDVHALTVDSGLEKRSHQAEPVRTTRSFPLYQQQCSHCNTKFWSSQATPPTPSTAGIAKGMVSICPVCIKGKPQYHQRIIESADSHPCPPNTIPPKDSTMAD